MDRFKDKKNIYVIFILLAMGVIIMASGSLYGKEEVTVQSEEESEVTAQGNTELSELLSQVKGAGEVKVIVSYSEGSERVIAYNTKEENTTSDNNISHSLDSEAVLSRNDAPFVLKEIYPKPLGVVVLAQGAEDTRLKAELIKAVMAYFNIDANRIEVLTMK